MVFVVLISSTSFSFILLFGFLLYQSDCQTYSDASACPGLPESLKIIRVFALPSPYFFGENSTTGTKNSGFLVDLLDSFHDILGSNFSLTSRPDLNWGSTEPNLFGALMNNEADLVGPDLFVFEEEERVVDFLMPFDINEIQILANAKFGLTNSTQYLSLGMDTVNYLLCKSVNSTLQQICQNIRAGVPGSIVLGDQQALDLVLTGNYAYIGASAFIGPAVAQNTGMIYVAGNIIPIYLSLAVQQGSPLREILNLALLQLEENGTILLLLRKYQIDNGISSRISRPSQNKF